MSHIAPRKSPRNFGLRGMFRRALLGTALVQSLILAACHQPPAAITSADTCRQANIKVIAESALRDAVNDEPRPGLTAAVFLPSQWSSVVSVSRGLSDYERQTPMRPDDVMLAGSVGKTFFAAAALSLADDGRLDLDAAISDYLPQVDLPNASEVTVRMLMSHTSGYGEYDAAFMEDLIRDPERQRELSDWIGPIQRNLPSAPGTYRYSDINYVLLAAVIEAAAGTSAYDYISQTFLHPYGLTRTRASNTLTVKDLVPGYAGATNFFTTDKMLVDGRLYYNPQFEWGGGGFASTSGDLARWIVLFSAGDAVSRLRWAEASQPTHVDPENGDGYGLGIHIDTTALGTAYGHSGYVPGYLSWVRWYESAGIAVAMQTNASDDARVIFDGYDVIDRIAVEVDALCGP